MGDKRDQGSKLDQPYHDGSGSKLDKLYHDGSGSKLDKLYHDGGGKDDATKAAEAERRVEQRLYRHAVRNKDYRTVAAFHARSGFQARPGITRHGQYDAQDRKTAENFTQEGQRLYNNRQQGASEIERAAGTLGTGSGDSPENAKTSSSGREGVNVGQGASAPSATPSSATTASTNGNQDARDVLEGVGGYDVVGQASPAPSEPKGLSKLPGESDFDFVERVKQQRGKTEGAYGVDLKAVLAGLKDKFAKQDAARAAADPFATVTPIDPRYQATPEQITEADNESFAKSYGDYLNSDEGKNATREQKDAKYAELKKAYPGFRVTDEAKAAVASKTGGDIGLAESLAKFEQNRGLIQTEGAKKDAERDAVLKQAREASLEAEAEGQKGAADLKRRHEEENKTREALSIAQDAIQKERGSLIESGLNTLTLFSDAFVPSQLFEGNWMEDPRLLPSAEEAKNMTPEAIKGYAVSKVRDRVEGFKNFNRELGAKTKTKGIDIGNQYTPYGMPGQDAGKAQVEYETDAFSSMKRRALGMTPNFNYDPNRDSQDAAKPSAPRTIAESFDQQIIRGIVRPVVDKITGSTKESRQREFNKAHDSEISSAQLKIIGAALRSGHPIWEDKELMADPSFRKRIEENSTLNAGWQKYKARQESKDAVSAVNPKIPLTTTKVDKEREAVSMWG